MIKQIYKVAVLLLAMQPVLTHAQKPSVEWDKTIGGKDADNITSIALTPDGGYIVGGYTSSGQDGDKTIGSKGNNDYWIIKLSASGTIEWQKGFGGKGDDYLRSIKTTPDGGYIAGGTSNSGKEDDKSDVSRGGDDYWIIKLDAKGNKEWDKTIGGDNVDQLAGVWPSDDGGYIVGGTSSSNKSGEKSANKKGGDPRDPSVAADYWIVKLDAKGGVQWDKTFGGGSGSARFQDLAIVKDGYLLAGYSMSPKANDKSENSRGQYDYWIIRTDLNGNLKWDKTIGGASSDQLQSVITTDDGGFLLGGNSGSNKSGEKTEDAMGSDYWIVKLKSDGGIEWDKTIGSKGEDYVSSMQVTKDKGYIFSGQSGGGISGDKTEDVRSVNGTNYWLVKTDNKGKVEWDKTIGSKNDLTPRALQTADNGYIIAGSSNGDKKDEKSENSRGSFDYWIVKLGVCKAVTTEVKAAICEGETYTLPWGNKVSKAGTYKDTLVSVSKCDSFVITHLEVNKPFETELTAKICNGEKYLLPDGSDVSTAGVYEVKLRAVTGCDSIIITTLTQTVIDTVVQVNDNKLTAAEASAESYQWINCDKNEAIAGATEQSLSVEESGSYKVVITKDGCSDTSSCFTVKVKEEDDDEDGDGDVHIRYLSDNEQAIRVFPNPADQSVFIHNQTESPVQYIKLVDIAGKTVWEEKFVRPSAVSEINISTLANGMYFLNISTGNSQHYMKKVIKK